MCKQVLRDALNGNFANVIVQPWVKRLKQRFFRSAIPSMEPRIVGMGKLDADHQVSFYVKDNYLKGT